MNGKLVKKYRGVYATTCGGYTIERGTSGKWFVIAHVGGEMHACGWVGYSTMEIAREWLEVNHRKAAYLLCAALSSLGYQLQRREDEAAGRRAEVEALYCELVVGLRASGYSQLTHDALLTMARTMHERGVRAGAAPAVKA